MEKGVLREGSLWSRTDSWLGCSPMFPDFEIRNLCNPLTALGRFGGIIIHQPQYRHSQGPREIIPEPWAIQLKLVGMYYSYTPDLGQHFWTHHGLCHNSGCAREWGQWWGHPDVATNRPRFHSPSGCPHGQASEGPISIPDIDLGRISAQESLKKLVIWKALRCFQFRTLFTHKHLPIYADGQIKAQTRGENLYSQEPVKSHFCWVNSPLPDSKAMSPIKPLQVFLQGFFWKFNTKEQHI